jgi:hypothetical protein
MQASDRRSEDWAFLLQVRSALYRVAALLIFLLAHKLLNVTLEWAVPKKLTDALLLLESIAFAAFGVIYVALVVEMVVVFIPALRRKMYPQRVNSDRKGMKMNTQTVTCEDETRKKTEAECVRRITPPTIKDVSLTRIIERCATLLPMLFLFSTLGCLVGHYILLVPFDRLGVVVLVPMAIGFLLVKWTMLAFPFDPEEAKRQKMPSLAFRFFGIAMIFAVVLSVSFLLSSPVYYLLGWADLGGEALKLAAVGFGIAILSLIGTLQQVVPGELLALLVVGLWRMAILFLFPRLVVSRFHHGGGAAAGV